MLPTNKVNVTEIPEGRLFVDMGILYVKLPLGENGGVFARKIAVSSSSSWLAITSDVTTEFDPRAEVRQLAGE